MSDFLDFSSLSLVAIVAIILTLAIFGPIGYLIASRRIKQSLLAFLVRFAICFLLLVIIEAFVLSLWPSVHEQIAGITVIIVGGVLSSVGVSESVSGTTITLNDPFLIFSVDAACLGGILLWAYTGLVFAESRVTLKQRLVGIIFGLAIILGFNFFRIVTSIYLEWRTGVHVHDYFYIVNMALVLLVWAGWLKILKPNQAVARPASKQQVISGVKSE